MSTISIRGREYQVSSERCREDGSVYFIKGKRGHKWFTMRNKPNPKLLFLMPEKNMSNTMDGVWLTDENGILEVVQD